MPPPRRDNASLDPTSRLVLALRETPLHGGHLRTMTRLSDMGAIVAPIVPAFYQRPKTLEDIIDHSIGRLLDLFGIDLGTVHRWKEPTIAEPSGTRKPKGERDD